MKSKSIQINTVYHLTLGRNEVLGEVVAATENGWEVRLTASDKVIKVNNSDRFLRKARVIATTHEEAAETPLETEVIEVEPQVPEAVITPSIEAVRPQGMSAIDVAHRVLIEIGTPLNVRQIAETAIERGYCPNLKGKTPQATISSCLQREIARKQSASRFYKVSKGQYAAVECRQD